MQEITVILRKYIKMVIEQNKDKQYDYVLVVKSEAFGEKELELLRNAYKNAEFILYLWDSVVNVPDGEKKKLSLCGGTDTELLFKR